jgi:hypothetical protein
MIGLEVVSRARAGVLGVPELELPLWGGEVGTKFVIEVRDRRALLEELIVEPAVGVAGVPVSLVALERGAAFVTRHIARPEHVFEGSAAPRQP